MTYSIPFITDLDRSAVVMDKYSNTPPKIAMGPDRSAQREDKKLSGMVVMRNPGISRSLERQQRP
jgi:hypothetical protein